MVVCNKELIQTIQSNEDDMDEITSDFDEIKCQNLNPNADLLDFRTEMDQLSFYEKTDFEPCKDLWMISDAECLWQCIVGEVKTPYGALSNSLGQMNYGCKIWKIMGRKIDHLEIRDFESYIIETCLKYPEVINVTNIDTKVGVDSGSFLCNITIDSIYGPFSGELRIPNAKPSKKHWLSSKEFRIS